MKLFLTCQACISESGIDDVRFYAAEVLDERIANFKCLKGHSTSTIVQLEKHEILSEIAINAIIDGYYREAVSSFTATLERFYELYLRTVFADKQLDDVEFDEPWKLVKKQSERQFGAFLFLYVLEEGKSPPCLSQRSIAFRNRVIHEGLIPTRDEAIGYGQGVLDVITPVMNALVLQKKDTLQNNLFRNLSAAYENSPSESQFSSTAKWPTLMDWSRTEGQEQPTVQEWLIHIEKMRPGFRSKAVS